MFFVGITGQLITLILTVFLPFVFLVSSQPKIELVHETLNFENPIAHYDNSSAKINCFITHSYYSQKLQDIKIVVKEVVIQKMLPTEFRVKWKSFYAESSGNKAPPEIHYFHC